MDQRHKSSQLDKVRAQGAHLQREVDANAGAPRALANFSDERCVIQLRQRACFLRSQVQEHVQRPVAVVAVDAVCVFQHAQDVALFCVLGVARGAVDLHARQRARLQHRQREPCKVQSTAGTKSIEPSKLLAMALIRKINMQCGVMIQYKTSCSSLIRYVLPTACPGRGIDASLAQ